MINSRVMQTIITFIRECIRIAGLVISGTHIKLKNKISQKFGDRSGESTLKSPTIKFSEWGLASITH